MGQHISFDDIRRQLCFDPVKYVAGSWFRLPENEVRSKSTNKPFARQKAEAGKGIGKPGEVISDYLEIACGDKQSIKIKEIQRQGKKPQNIGEFMLGSRIKKGIII